MFEFFTKNDLISHNQPGFNHGTPASISYNVSLTIFINHSMMVLRRGVFLDTSKAFDKVWHEGILFKLKQNGISGNVLNVITDFFCQMKGDKVLF